VLEFPGLTYDALDEPRVAVAQVAGPPGRDCVHVPVAFAVEKKYPFASRHDRKTVPERRMPRVWVPQTCQINLAIVAGKVFHNFSCFVVMIHRRGLVIDRSLRERRENKNLTRSKIREQKLPASAFSFIIVHPCLSVFIRV
jgi:hypothetical protein